MFEEEEEDSTMILNLESLPTNTSELQHLVASLAKKHDVIESNFVSIKKEKNTLASKLRIADKAALKYQDQYQKLFLEHVKIVEQLKLYKHKQYGKSSEKTKQKVERAELQAEDRAISLGLGTDDNVSSSDERKNKNKPKRQPLPEDLPRDNIVLEPAKQCSNCGGESFRTISEDVSEVLEYVPARFRVKRYIRPRCACTNCEKITQAYPASKGIDKGMAGFGLLSHVMVQKYCDHLPLYRQSEIYLREGIIIPRSTMVGWLKKCADLLDPLVEQLKKEIFSADHIHGDDTPVKVMGGRFGKTKVGRIWTYVRDGRPHGNNIPPAVCYYYSPDRKGIRPEAHLTGFKGVLHADAYAGYNGVYITKEHPDRGVFEACCWAHVRRKFYDITVASDNATIAHETLEQIGKLYKIEEAVRGKAPEERQVAREEHSKKLVEDLFNCFKKVRDKLPPKGATAKAINYALNNEEALKRFLRDGAIEIDNNAAERAIRSIALGRKNWLFAGSDGGGEITASIYTLTETAKLNGINPWAYLRKVLSVIQDHNSQKLSDLLPWNIQLE